MTILFLFAHPDDETIGCAGTIRQLANAGHKVVLVTATDGGAGEVAKEAEVALKKAGSVGQLRRQEQQAAAKLMGISELRILNFQDGEITNKQVWAELTTTFIEYIDQYQPDLVITFDHSGWYFHLDHVGVSIAATLAVQQATNRPAAFLMSHFRVHSSRWKYVFADKLAATHQVGITSVLSLKKDVLRAHKSQDLLKTFEEASDRDTEFYQLVHKTDQAEKTLTALEIFKPL